MQTTTPSPSPTSPPKHARAHLNSTSLVRWLTGLGIGANPEASAGTNPTVAEQLSSWLDWTDAQALFTELQHERADIASESYSGQRDRLQRVTAECQRVRAELARAIATDGVFTDAMADASTCQRHHLAHQRTMAARLAPLRATVRAALTAHSPVLGRLAALDALLDQALDARERQLCSRVPALLAQRNGRAQPATDTIASPERQAMLGALLAELDTRLQPIEGLLEALAATTRAP